MMPGPDILFVINQSLEDRKSGLLVAFELCSGLIIHTLVLAFGLSAIIEQNNSVIIFFKYFGSAYLFYLAFQEFKKNRAISVRQKKTLYKRSFYESINPKVLIFFLHISQFSFFRYYFYIIPIYYSWSYIYITSIDNIFNCFTTSNRLISILNVDATNKKIVYLKSFIFVLIGMSILL